MTAEPGPEGPGTAEAPDHLVVGHIAKVHGNRGEVFVWPLTDRPERVFAEEADLLLGDAEGALGAHPEAVRVERQRPFKKGYLVKLVGFEDRTAVERLARRYLLAPLEELDPLEEGELFYHQLLGMEVVTEAGIEVGRVREVFETEPSHLLEVKGPEKTHLVPFTEAVVRRVDVEERRLIITPPEGLLEI